ncbi:MAG: bifunctional adenosylcobinamide kinase/adenosylcobinamide-phosphate guanylyltransferase [Oscillospiraceae bacterium]|nr:bifunctional adenosylcobinamide kinase/adenosylcobinamide-phosphate guanylyltransferase [Oscillospiraceae bacterium]
MIMITGGAFQGKTDYMKKRFSLTDDDIADGGRCEISELSKSRYIKHYELAVRRMIPENIDPLAFTEGLECEAIELNEIGCGIIPIDKNEREWREMTGRAGCIIAEKASEVVRVCCGIPTVIKGEKH